MEHTKQVEILKALMQQLDEGKNIDAGVQYRHQTKPMFVLTGQQRKRNNSSKPPQLIGLSGDLPKKGSYLALDDFGVPILATRDKDGQFRVFQTRVGTAAHVCQRARAASVFMSISPMELRTPVNSSTSPMMIISAPTRPAEG